MQLTKGTSSTQRTTPISTMPTPMRWSDIVASRESTHPEAESVYQIINTTELLEQVLLHLPPLDLLRVQSVCRKICKLIKTSPTLQTHLFLRPARYSKPEKWVIDSEPKSLLTGAYADLFTDNAAEAGHTIKLIQPCIINPLIVLKMCDNPSTLRHFFNHTGNLSFAIVPKKLTTQLERANASCINMYLTQPPVTTIQLWFYGRAYYDEVEMWDRRGLPRYYEDWIATPTISNPQGLKLIDVMEAARYQRGEMEFGVFLNTVVFTPKVQEAMDLRNRAGIENDDDDE